jgi:hypothetical protein
LQITAKHGDSNHSDNIPLSSLHFITMKFSLVALLIASLLSACSDKVAESGKTAPSAASSSAGAFIPVTGTRPASIPSALKGTDNCAVDLINAAVATESTAIADKTQVSLTGWAADSVTGTVPKEVFLEIDGPAKSYIQAATGISRPDVASHFNKPALGTAGWSAAANLGSLPSGTYVLRVIQLSGSSVGALCDPHRVIVLNSAGG